MIDMNAILLAATVLTGCVAVYTDACASRDPVSTANTFYRACRTVFPLLFLIYLLRTLDLAVFLLFATCASGLISVIDSLFWRRRRMARLKAVGFSEDFQPKYIEYARSFFPVLLLVFILRSFVIEPYRIPSGSMKPTLAVGDFIVVNKYQYGLRLPVFNQLLVRLGKPQRGDVMVFHYPVEPQQNFIKRVIGIPGDKIVYENKQLFINDKPVSKVFTKNVAFIDESGQAVSVREFIEQLTGHAHAIYEKSRPGYPAFVARVPEGKYFMMGDNRDASNDSRIWGFVDDKYVVGKAFAVWLSWDPSHWRLRWRTMPRWIV